MYVRDLRLDPENLETWAHIGRAVDIISRRLHKQIRREKVDTDSAEWALMRVRTLFVEARDRGYTDGDRENFRRLFKELAHNSPYGVASWPGIIASWPLPPEEDT